MPAQYRAGTRVVLNQSKVSEGSVIYVLAQPRIIPFTNSTHAIHEWEALARIPGWHMPFVNSICQSGIASLGN